MRLLSESQLNTVLAGVAAVPRVVISGNFAAPRRALGILDNTVAEYRLFALNAQRDVPDRAGVTHETPFVGPGMRGRAGLRYFPSRLSLAPHLLKQSLPPDIVLVHTSTPVAGTVSLGTEVNILPAAIEAARSRGGLVIAQLNPHRTTRPEPAPPVQNHGTQPHTSSHRLITVTNGPSNRPGRRIPAVATQRGT